MALHAPVLLASAVQPRAASGRRVAAIDFDVNVLPPAVLSIEPAPEPIPPSSPAPVRRSPRRSVAGAAEAAAAAPPAVEVEPLPEPEVLADAEASAMATGPVQRDLSPLAAARSLSLATPERSVVSARPATSHAREEARLAEDIPGLVRDRRVSERSVGELAQDLQGAVLRPWDLVLQPLKRARYRYRGEGFDAVIAADGSVKYRDKEGLRLSVGQRQMLKEPGRGRGKGRSPNLPVFGLDLGDPKHWVDKITGKDPHASERRTFLERTRALREYLREQTERSARETRDGPPLAE